jgi:hypothetical protein
MYLFCVHIFLFFCEHSSYVETMCELVWLVSPRCELVNLIKHHLSKKIVVGCTLKPRTGLYPGNPRIHGLMSCNADDLSASYRCVSV